MPSRAFPIVRLDFTLYALYAHTYGSHSEVVLVATYPESGLSQLPRYVYHDNRSITSSKDHVPLSHREEAIQKSLRAQKFAFCAGPMPVIIFDHSQIDQSSASIFRNAAVATMSVLDPEQRPNMVFCKSSLDVALGKGTKLAVRLPLDTLVNLPHVIDPDLHYEMLSKRWLASSGLQTPPTEIIDTDGNESCIHALKPDWQSPSRRDDAKTSPAISQSGLSAILDLLRARTLPFVFKMQQTILGMGTMIIRNSADREALLAQLPSIHEFATKSVNESNRHLKPGTLLVSDYVSCPNVRAENFAISFFVHQDGHHTFVGCVNQVVDEEHHWEGATMCFPQQEQLYRRFYNTLCDVTKVLHAQGYYGAAGFDALEDEHGQQWVVDVNVRPTGSLVLGLLKSFLWQQRGLGECFLVSSTRLTISRNQFTEHLAQEMLEGKVVIVAWVADGDTDECWASLVIGAETQIQLADLWQKIKQIKDHIQSSL